MKSNSLNKIFLASTLCVASAAASAAVFQDEHGNVGYSSAAECNAAIANGTAKFYRAFTKYPAKLRRGEVTISKMLLKQVNPRYNNGACDLGVGKRDGRNGVSKELQGKYVPYSPNMMVNVYSDRSGMPVRVSMGQCDNWFSAPFPQPFVKPYTPPKAQPQPVYVPPKPIVPKGPSAAAIKAAHAARAAEKTANDTASGSVNILPVVGVVAAVAVAAAVIANND